MENQEKKRSGTQGQGLTTAEMSRMRQQKQRRVAAIGAICGLSLATVGLFAYFAPNSQGTPVDGTIVEGDPTTLRSTFVEPTEEELAYQNIQMVTSASIESAETELPFPPVSEEEAQRRSEEALTEIIPVDTQYVEGELIVSMASGTTDDDVAALVERTGYSVTRELVDGDTTVGSVLLMSVVNAPSIQTARSEILADPNVYKCGFNEEVEESGIESEAFTSVDGDVWIEPGYDNLDEVAKGEVVTTSEDKTPEELENIVGSAIIEGDYEVIMGENNIAKNVDNENYVQMDDPNNDPMNSNRWDRTRMKVDDAWLYARTDSKVTVAVIDSGFSLSHLDLKTRYVSPHNVITNDNNVQPVSGHGTHVAGIIAAEAGNSFGISGISGNAKIMPIQVGKLDAEQGKSTIRVADVIAGLDYVNAQTDKNAVSPPVKVVNVSLQMGALSSDTADNMRNVLTKLQQRNILVVAAAGNKTKSDSNPKGVDIPSRVYPAAYSETYSNVIGVINLEDCNGDGSAVTRNVLSNYNPDGGKGTCYQVAAPGTGILSCWPFTEAMPGGKALDSSIRSDKAFMYLSGTSQAAPQVAGLAAVLFAANPRMTAQEVRNTICDTALDLGETGVDSIYGYGEIQPKAAIQKVTGQTDAPAPANDVTSTQENTGQLGATIYRTSHAPSAKLNNLQVEINGHQIPQFDATNSNKIVRIEYTNPIEQEKFPKMKFRWAGLENGGGRFDIYELVTKALPVTDDMGNEIKKVLLNGDVVVEYHQYYQEAFTDKGAGLDGDILAIYTFQLAYYRKVGEDKDKQVMESSMQEAAFATDIADSIVLVDSNGAVVPGFMELGNKDSLYQELEVSSWEAVQSPLHAQPLDEKTNKWMLVEDKYPKDEQAIIVDPNTNQHSGIHTITLSTNDELQPTILTFNVRAFSSDEKYDTSKSRLTIEDVRQARRDHKAQQQAQTDQQAAEQQYKLNERTTNSQKVKQNILNQKDTIGGFDVTVNASRINAKLADKQLGMISFAKNQNTIKINSTCRLDRTTGYLRKKCDITPRFTRLDKGSTPGQVPLSIVKTYLLGGEGLSLDEVLNETYWDTANQHWTKISDITSKELIQRADTLAGSWTETDAQGKTTYVGALARHTKSNKNENVTMTINDIVPVGQITHIKKNAAWTREYALAVTIEKNDEVAYKTNMLLSLSIKDKYICDELAAPTSDLDDSSAHDASEFDIVTTPEWGDYTFSLTNKNGATAQLQIPVTSAETTVDTAIGSCSASFLADVSTTDTNGLQAATRYADAVTDALDLKYFKIIGLQCIEKPENPETGSQYLFKLDLGYIGDSDARPADSKTYADTHSYTLVMRIESVTDDDDQGVDESALGWKLPQEPSVTDPFEALKNLECWIAGKKYQEFDYSKQSYVISFDVNEALPSAPEMKNVPTDQGWKISSTKTSQQNVGNGVIHYVVITGPSQTNPNGVSRQYAFTFAKNVPTAAGSTKSNPKNTVTTVVTPASGTNQKPQSENVTTVAVNGLSSEAPTASPTASPEQAAPVAENAPAGMPQTGTYGTTIGSAASGRNVADTSPVNRVREALTQTGDPVVIIAGAIIAAMSIGWLVVTKKRPEA